MPIERRPLRDQIKDELLHRLGLGDFDPDQVINEVQLAAELGVSRTPLREALIALEREGIIRSEQGKGFRFAALSPKDFRELNVIVAAMEALALELIEPATLQATAPLLLQKAREFDLPRAELGLIERYDDEWHHLLLRDCPNERLMDMITSLKLGLHRYERVIVGDTDVLERSAEEHARIAECLLDGDIPGAVAALKTNWHSGMQRILERLDDQSFTGRPGVASPRS